MILWTPIDTHGIYIYCTEHYTVHCSVHCTLYTRLLHPQHLDGIWIGLIHYRLPYAPLSEYPEPWF